MLNHFAVTSCALYLLEHATWSYQSKEPTYEVDTEAFRRWVERGDLARAERDINVVRNENEGA